MCFSSRSPVGSCSAPSAKLIVSSASAAQNRNDPQRGQNPRLACALAAYHFTVPEILKSDRATWADAQRWPDCLRHCPQWHTLGPCGLAPTVNVTSPHRHDPVSITPSPVLRRCPEPRQDRKSV